MREKLGEEAFEEEAEAVTPFFPEIGKIHNI